MKFTSKKTISEVVIDLEDGCVLKLTNKNLKSISMIGQDYLYLRIVRIELSNGISVEVEAPNNLITELNCLINSR